MQAVSEVPIDELGANLFIQRLSIRLSPRATRFTTARMEQFLKRIGASGIAYRRWSGGQTFGEFIAANPTWSLRAWQVLMLENRDLIQQL